MCGWFLLAPEGRTNPLKMSLTHLSSDCDSLVGKGAGEAVTPWVSVLRGFPAPVLSRGLEGEELSQGVTATCPTAGGSLLACLSLQLLRVLHWPFE